MYLRVLRQLVKVLSKAHSIIYQQSLLTRELTVDWKLANVSPIYRKFILEDVSYHGEKKKIVRNTQHGFMKNKSCLTRQPFLMV